MDSLTLALRQTTEARFGRDGVRGNIRGARGPLAEPPSRRPVSRVRARHRPGRRGRGGQARQGGGASPGTLRPESAANWRISRHPGGTLPA